VMTLSFQCNGTRPSRYREMMNPPLMKGVLTRIILNTFSNSFIILSRRYFRNKPFGLIELKNDAGFIRGQTFVDRFDEMLALGGEVMSHFYFGKISGRDFSELKILCLNETNFSNKC